MVAFAILAMAPAASGREPVRPEPAPVEAAQPAASAPATRAPAGSLEAAPGTRPAVERAARPGARPLEAGAHQAPSPAPSSAHGPEPHGESEAGHQSPWTLVAKVVNFALLVGGLVYLLREPVSLHLQNRRRQISGDLDAARDTTAAAERQLAEIDRRLAALPAELESMRAKGAEEIAAEEASIRERAERERQRLLAQIRWEIDLEVRLARRHLTEHAADLAVKLAADRIASTMTDDDRERALDRYVSRMKELNG